MRALSTLEVLAERPLGHVLVLGGTGYIGAPLVRRLAAAGVRTTCLVHRRPSPVPEAGAVHGSLDAFRWRSLDHDPPDVIFHLARIPGRGPLTRARNRVANERLLSFLAGTARPPLLVYVGGTLVYGSRGEAEVTEETPLAPTSFSRDYHDAELPWLRALRASDAPVIVARPAWVLGPGSWFEAYYRAFIRAEGAVPLYGGGDNWMSLVHVEDCAAMLVQIARAAPPMTTVNLFAGAPMRQRDLAERLARLTALPVRPVPARALEERSGRAVREAFEFSARIGTVHGALHATFERAHEDLDADLAALLQGACGSGARRST